MIDRVVQQQVQVTPVAVNVFLWLFVSKVSIFIVVEHSIHEMNEVPKIHSFGD
jgi:hypothetical protein